MIRVLHLDDNPFELEKVQKSLTNNRLGYEFHVVSVSDSRQFGEALEKENPDLVLLDINLGEGAPQGVGWVEMIKEKVPVAAVIMCSAHDDASTVAQCLKLGADDFLSKRADRGEMALRLYHSLELSRLKKGLKIGGSLKNAGYRSTLFAGHTMDKIASRMSLLLKSAVSTVHIQGESGTGKEVVADLLEEKLSANEPFIRVNCGAITPSLLESELFGHMKGAFTGAGSDKKGYFESASGGWIFLDEVASLSLSAQAALLRTIENQEVQRVGSTQPIRISVRVLSASNVPLKTLVVHEKFRGDLWQRLCETEIVLPPLRERRDEIPALVEHFCQNMPGGPYRVTPPLLQVLQGLEWRSGNIRELRNCLRSMTEFHVQGLLTPLAVPERIWQQMDDSPSEDDKMVATRNSTQGASIELSVDSNEPIVFDDLSDRLLLELTRKLATRYGKLSLRRMSRMVNISRSTLSSRLRGLVQKGFVEFHDLSKWVGVVDSGESGPE